RRASTWPRSTAASGARRRPGRNCARPRRCGQRFADDPAQAGRATARGRIQEEAMPTSIARCGPDDEVLRFAAEEIAAYAARLTGEAAGPGAPEGGASLVLRVDERIGDGDAFLLRSGEEGLTIASGGSRGVLHGVYAYLESLGVRFPFPGAEHEVVPRRELAFDGYER